MESAPSRKKSKAGLRDVQAEVEDRESQQKRIIESAFLVEQIDSTPRIVYREVFEASGADEVSDVRSIGLHSSSPIDGGSTKFVCEPHQS